MVQIQHCRMWYSNEYKTNQVIFALKNLLYVYIEFVKYY